MAGKKYGLEDKYKSLGVRERTISINPMQDDLEKLKGMTAAIGNLPAVSKTAAKGFQYGITDASKYLQRSITLRPAGSSKGLANNLRDRATALRLTAGRSNVKETIKKALTSKTNIGATAGAAGYEIGKSESEAETEGKKSGGMMSKKEKKIKKVMGEYKKGELNIGTSKKKVKSKKQAIAIALSKARKKKA